MTNIELSPVQREQLLEMCRALFLKEDIQFSRIKETMLLFVSWIIEGEEENRYIHWYEFCMTHLAEKVIESFEHQSFTPHSWASHIVMQQLYARDHPIDVLYKIWKHPQDHISHL